MDKMDRIDTWHYTARLFSLNDLLHPDELNLMGAMGWELLTMDRLPDRASAQQRWLAV